MARALCGCAREPRELWVVEGAKHNMALHTAGDEYRRRVLEFFDLHLAPEKTIHHQDTKNAKKRRNRIHAASRASVSQALRI